MAVDGWSRSGSGSSTAWAYSSPTRNAEVAYEIWSNGACWEYPEKRIRNQIGSCCGGCLVCHQDGNIGRRRRHKFPATSQWAHQTQSSMADSPRRQLGRIIWCWKQSTSTNHRLSFAGPATTLRLCTSRHCHELPYANLSTFRIPSCTFPRQFSHSSGLILLL